eukprot:15889464-Heterocapsa_arctica.AAC.1
MAAFLQLSDTSIMPVLAELGADPLTPPIMLALITEDETERLLFTTTTVLTRMQKAAFRQMFYICRRLANVGEAPKAA